MRDDPIYVILMGPLPPPIAGPELVTETLLDEGPMADIHYIFVDLSATSNTSRGRWSVYGVVRALKQAGRFAWVAWRWRTQAKIVHLPLSQSNPGVLRDLVLFRVAKIFGYKVVVQFHGGDFNRFWVRCRYRSLVSTTLSRADKLLVFDHRIKTQFPFMGPSRIAVLPNPVPSAWGRAFATLLERPREAKTLRILFVSHISVAKGFLDLVEALTGLPKAQAWELHIAGDRIDVEHNVVWTGANMDDGWARAMQILTERGFMDRVTYHGIVTGEDKQRLFQSGHVLALPSYSEGLPLVILEAMYAGLAVIATNVGAIPSLLPRAVLIRPGDVGALKTILATLDPVRCGVWGTENRLRVERGYLPRQVVENLRELYEEMGLQRPPIKLADRIPHRVASKWRSPP